MPTAHKLPSGSWRVQYTVNGQRRSVTGTTKKEAEYKALQDQLEVRHRRAAGVTIGEAVDQYIESRSAVLSPSTIQGYEKMSAKDLQGIRQIPVSKFTSAQYQKFVNTLARRVSFKGKPVSPKYVANVCGLLTAAIRSVDPDADLRATLPAPKKRLVEMLSPEAVISIVTGSAIELPVLLAMWLSLSLSEIRGLTVDSVRGGRLHVDGAVVDIGGVPVHKETNKAFERTRELPIPDRIMDLIEQTDAWRAGTGYLVPLRGCALHDRWISLQRRAGVEHPMTFHQLRHLCASVMLSLGIPDTYAMTRGGWASRYTLNNVYQHTIANRQQGYDDRINRFFESLYES